MCTVRTPVQALGIQDWDLTGGCVMALKTETSALCILLVIEHKEFDSAAEAPRASMNLIAAYQPS